MSDTYQPSQFGTPDYYTPQGVPGIRIGRSPKSGADEWEGYGKPFDTSAKPKPEVAPEDDWEKYGAKFGTVEPKEQPQVTPMQAFGAGLKNVFGAGPAIAGLAEASGIPEPDMYESVDPVEQAKRAGTYVARPFVGLAKIAHNWITGNEDPATVQAYNAGRQSSLDYNDAAFKQDPKAYLLGQLTQAVAMPLSGGSAAAEGAGAIGRMLGAARAGALGGGFYGAGEGISQDKSLGDIGIDVGTGAATGALGGAGLQGIFEGAGKTIGRIGTLVRGNRSPKDEAQRKMVEAFTSDQTNPLTPTITPQQGRIAKATGMPLVAGDVGGPEVHGLADWAARHSPDAKWALGKFAHDRFEAQAPRMAALMRAINPVPADMDALRQAAAAVTDPLYKKAYALGKAVPLTAKLKELTDTSAVQGAINQARSKWKDWQYVTRYSGKSDLHFWDIVHRELSNSIAQAVRSGSPQDVARLTAIHSDLMKELDRLVPEFVTARQSHALFKRGEGAYETGQEWINNPNVDLKEAQKYYSKLIPAERELLAHGFAEDFITKMQRLDDRQNVLGKIRRSDQARELMDMALGSRRSQILQSGLGLEEIADRLRAAGGNSATTLGLAESARHTGGAVATVEAMKDQGIHPLAMLMSALGWSALKKHAAHIDERVARETAQMILSGDPDQFAAAVKRVSASRIMREAVRRFGEAGTRTTLGNLPSVRSPAAAIMAHISGEKDEHHPNSYQEFPGGTEMLPR